MSVNKPRVIKDFCKLDAALIERVRCAYPQGFTDNLISFINKDGAYISALPFETDDRYYLIRMSSSEAQKLLEEEEGASFSEDNNVNCEIQKSYKEKHSDLDLMGESLEDILTE